VASKPARPQKPQAEWLRKFFLEEKSTFTCGASSTSKAFSCKGFLFEIPCETHADDIRCLPDDLFIE
jgi:hypothetical protein